MKKTTDLGFCSLIFSSEDFNINYEKELIIKAYDFNRNFAKIEIPKFEIKIVYSREEFEGIWGSKTSDYVSAFAKEDNIVIFAYEVFEKETKWSKEKFEEALNPNQVAISLTGEPTIYPYLSELIRIYKTKGFTVFLVTNGTLPKVLENLYPLPTQLYISLTSYDYDSFVRLNRPISTSLWGSIFDSLSLIKSLECPNVLRITSIKGMNMERPEAFAKIITKYEPLYVETKAYMNIGYSIYRLRKENMPTHDEIKSFSSTLASLTGYKVIGESKDSRVVLLSKKLSSPQRFN